MVSVCLPSDAPHNTFHLTWVSLTLYVGYVFTAAPAKCSHSSLPWMWGIFSQPLLLTLDMGNLLLPAPALHSLNFQTFKLLKDTLKLNKPSSAVCLKDGPGHPAFPSCNSGSRACDHETRNLHSACPNPFLLLPARFAVHQKQWPQDWKRSVFIPIPKKGNDKECSDYRTIALISQASKEMLKILEPRIQQ